MNLSISNIAWSKELDEEIYQFLNKQGVTAIEIAPTRIFPENPYDNLKEACEYSKIIKDKYNLSISSIQSIWYGISESIFGSEKDREKLIDYTKKAIDFANVINCENLVFGCPKNRNIPSKGSLCYAIDFFKEVGDYAKQNNTIIAIEPNPVIYNTNFINTTKEAFEFCRIVDNKAIKVNVDLGTIIYNNEDFSTVKDSIELVNHIHISEPMLEPIEKRALHAELKYLQYNKYFSIEMGNKNDCELVKNKILYIMEVLD